MKNIYKGFFGLLYIFLLLAVPQSVQAQEGTSSSSTADLSSAGGFAYEVLHPDNQENRDVGYFDLRMVPGEKRIVQIRLTNPTTVETIISVKLNGGKTNSNGVIEYGPSTIENDASLRYPFEEVVKGPEEIKIPPKGETMLELEITMPEASYDGIIAGGIELQNITNEEVLEEQQSGTVINKYAYLIGMVLKETDTEVIHDLSLNKVYAGLSNYRNTIFINYSNTQAAFVSEMTTDVQISKKGSSEVLYDTKKAAMQMAPNSHIDFPVSMQGERMEPGEYTAHIVVTTDKDRWEWTEDFTITDEEAEKYNGEDVGLLQETGVDWKIIAAIVAGVFVLLLIIFFVVRQLGKKKESKKNRKRKAKKKQGSKR